MENQKTILVNGQELTTKEFNALKVKELAETLNVSVEDAKAVKQAVVNMDMTIEDALSILEVVIKTPSKSRKRTSAPIHKVFARLNEVLGDNHSTSFNKKEVVANVFENEFGVLLSEYNNIKGIAKIALFKKVADLKEIDFDKVPNAINNTLKSIERSFAVSGDGTSISTNKGLMSEMQIERLKNGDYVAHTPKSDAFATLLEVATEKRNKRLNKTETKA